MSLILQMMTVAAESDEASLNNSVSWPRMSEKDFYSWLAAQTGKQRKEVKLAFLQWYYAEYL